MKITRSKLWLDVVIDSEMSCLLSRNRVIEYWVYAQVICFIENGHLPRKIVS